MTKLGPFWRRRPSTYTTIEDWGWCWVYLNKYGDVSVIEWIS